MYQQFHHKYAQSKARKAKTQEGIISTTLFNMILDNVVWNWSWRTNWSTMRGWDLRWDHVWD